VQSLYSHLRLLEEAELKKFYLIALSVLLIGATALADGVVKKTKSEIEFKKFGSFSSVQTEMISGLKKATDSENDFKGKGLMGKLAGRFALQSGRETRILDLPEMTATGINHKKKQYTVQPIETLSAEDTEDAGDAEEDEAADDEEESHIKIIRNEFSVDDTGENQTINGFASQKYVITWIMEWENTQTGEKGTTRLLTDVWSTPMAGEIQQARTIEQQFSQEYMQRMGLDLPELQQEILGSNWLGIFSQLDGQRTTPEQDASRFANEMKKIKGYPVIIDGKYFSETEGTQEEEAEQEGGIGGMLGGLAKKAIKKDKKDDSNQPALSYYIELLQLETKDIPEEKFLPPANYKKK
jgi:hypothetical protein